MSHERRIMADKDINIHVKAQDVEKSKQDIDSFGQSVSNVGKMTQQTGQQASEGAEKLSFWATQLNNIKGYLLGMVGGVAAINAVTEAVRRQRQEWEENARVITKQQEQILRLQFLGDYYKEKPELRKEVMAYAEIGRRPFEDVANAMFDLRNMGAAYTGPQREEILRRSLELGRIMPQAPLKDIVQSMILYSNAAKTTNFAAIENVLSKTLTKAEGEEAPIELAKFLPVATAAGLSGEQAAGLWSYAISQYPASGLATTALERMMLLLQGKTPEARVAMGRLGITPQRPFMEQFNQLVAKQPNLKQLEGIFDTRMAPVVLTLLQHPDMVRAAMSQATAAGQMPENLTQQSIQGLFGTDEMARLTDLSKFLDISIENLRGMNERSIRVQVGRKLQEATLRRETESPTMRWILRAMDWFPDWIMGMHRWENNVDVNQIRNYPLTQIQPKPPAVNIHNDYGDKYHPTVGDYDPNRFDPNSL